MQSGKLIQLLKTLNKKEFKEFQLFVGSEFYNKNQNLVKFLEFLSLYQGEFDSEKLERKSSSKNTTRAKHLKNKNSDISKVISPNY